MITPTTAWNLREMGLLLNEALPDHDYSNPRLKAIAQRQKALMDEFNALDEELKAMAPKEVTCNPQVDPLTT